MLRFRPYGPVPGFSPDFLRVRDFLVSIAGEGPPPAMDWVRWEWAFCLPYMDRSALSRMGLWEAGDRLVGLAAYEQGPGDVYLCADPRYREALYGPMLEHAERALYREGRVRVLIDDGDEALQRAARARGYAPTEDREPLCVYDVNRLPGRIALPPGFRVTSLSEEWNLREFHRALWRGFNHGEDVPMTAEELRDRRASLSGPDDDMALKIAVMSPEGEFVSFCGMWYYPGTSYAVAEPVATVPAFRRRGLGRAAVLEGIRRCAARSARRAYVGSDQLFYRALGFKPAASGTFWQKQTVR